VTTPSFDLPTSWSQFHNIHILQPWRWKHHIPMTYQYTHTRPYSVTANRETTVITCHSASSCRCCFWGSKPGTLSFLCGFSPSLLCFATNGDHYFEHLSLKSGTNIKQLHNVALKKKSPWPQPARELHWPSDCLLSAKLVPTFADRGCHVVSVMDHHGHILGFLDRSHYHLFQVAPQLCTSGLSGPHSRPTTSHKIC
jgi:hypothetical protein